MSEVVSEAGLGNIPGAGGGFAVWKSMIVYPFDRMYIYVPIFHGFCQGHFKSHHLHLASKPSHVGMSDSEVGMSKINHGRRFFPDGSHTAPVLLRLRILCR